MRRDGPETISGEAGEANTAVLVGVGGGGSVCGGHPVPDRGQTNVINVKCPAAPYPHRGGG